MILKPVSDGSTVVGNPARVITSSGAQSSFTSADLLQSLRQHHDDNQEPAMTSDVVLETWSGQWKPKHLPPNER